MEREKEDLLQALHNTSGIVSSACRAAGVSRTTYYRYYAVDYQNMYTNALGQNSSAQNEQGFATILTCRFPRSIIATASIDVFKFP